MKIIVIGLNPSKKSNSPTIKRLNEWLAVMDVRAASFENLFWEYKVPKKFRDDDRGLMIRAMVKQYDKVLALGRTASVTLTRLGVDHFYLQHPSGLNRNLNNKPLVDRMLKECKDYLWT